MKAYIRRIAKLIFIPTLWFYIVFIGAYLMYLFYCDFVGHPVIYKPLPPELERLQPREFESMGHFILRSLGLIEGGAFKGFHRNLQPYMPSLVLSFFSLFIVLVLIFRLIERLRRKQ